MNCQTCQDFAELQKAAARMEPQAPGISRTVNTYLIYHLSVVHGVSYQDLGVDTRTDTPTGATAGSALTQQA